jgi:hypothetical protein
LATLTRFCTSGSLTTQERILMAALIQRVNTAMIQEVNRIADVAKTNTLSCGHT